MSSLSQYSEPVLDPMWFAVWCYVVAWLIIIIICIECPPRFVRFWTIWCNKCGISLLGLVFCITFKFSLMRGRFTIQGCSFNPTTSQPICWNPNFTLHQSMPSSSSHKIVDTHQHLLDGSHSRRLLQPDRIKWRKFMVVCFGTSIKSLLLTLII